MVKTSKEQAIAALKEQIKMQKERMGEDELQELKNIAERILNGEKNIPAPNSKLAEGMVPYDKESAMKALKLYIQNSDNPEETERKIMEVLKKNQSTRH